MTNNKRDYIVKKLGTENIKYIYDNAQIFNCKPIEEVCEKIIKECNIKDGVYFLKDYCFDEPPRALSIGKLYGKLIVKLLEEENYNNSVIDKTIEVLSSWLVLKITNFNNILFMCVLDYLKECYIQGELLDY